MSRVIICDTSSQTTAKTKNATDDGRFEHEPTCQAHGFLSLRNARYFKRTGDCRCDVPMEADQ